MTVMRTAHVRQNKTKKTFRLNPALIEEVRRILGARTETETVEKALEQIRFKTDIRKWVDRTSGKYPSL